jgi:hypothetical protein
MYLILSRSSEATTVRSITDKTVHTDSTMSTSAIVMYYLHTENTYNEHYTTLHYSTALPQTVQH